MMKRRAFTKILGTATLSAIAAPLFGRNNAGQQSLIHKLSNICALKETWSVSHLEYGIQNVISKLQMPGFLIEQQSLYFSYDDIILTQIDTFSRQGQLIGSHIVFFDCSSNGEARDFLVLNALEVEGMIDLLDKAESIEEKRASLPIRSRSRNVDSGVRYTSKEGFVNIRVAFESDSYHILVANMNQDREVMMTASVDIPLSRALFS